MRTDVAVCLVLLLIFLSQAQGIRLPESLRAVENPKLANVSPMKQTSYGGEEEIESCKDGPCSGNSRELVTAVKLTDANASDSKSEKNIGKKPNTTTKSINDEKDGKHAKSIADSLDNDKHHGIYEQYSEAMQITEMDYTPARRKPPIHN